MIIDNHLKNVKFIRNKMEEIELLSLDNLNIINDLSEFILNNKNYIPIESFLVLVDTIVEFIENYNLGYIESKSIEIYKKSIFKLLESLESEIDKMYDIKIYYYGENQFGLMNSEFINYEFKYIKSKKELKKLMIKKRKPNEYNILFIDSELKLKNSFFNEILKSSQSIEIINNASNKLYEIYYNLRYLENAIEECSSENVESVIIGNSYPLVGIEERLLKKNTIKLAMSSQDLYYSFELAKKVISNNANIKQCIFGISYYILRHDLSKGESEYSKNMITNIYYPLLNDIHNSKLHNIDSPKTLKDFDLDILIANIFDMEKIEKHFNSQIYNKCKNYYNEIANPRKSHIKWEDFSRYEKELIGLDRANQHNKLFKYEDTKLEYSSILNDFLEFIDSRNIELIIVVFPNTRYYSNHIVPEFKREFDEVIERFKNKSIRIIDLRKYEDKFNDSDFWDSDHLNESGAVKATNYIKMEIEHI